MMKQPRGKRSLEAYKIFPYVAWGLIIGFVLFVYNIVVELQDTTAQLERQTTALQEQVAANPKQADFDSYNDNRFQPN
jgi:hypothetical protein